MMRPSTRFDADACILQRLQYIPREYAGWGAHFIDIDHDGCRQLLFINSQA
jgi:hypothetical protein